MANYGMRRNSAQNPGVSRICFGTSAMKELLGLDDKFAKTEQNANDEEAKAGKRQAAKLKRQEAAEFRKFVQSLELNTPIMDRAKVTRGNLLMDIASAQRTQRKNKCSDLVEVMELPGFNRIKSDAVRNAILDCLRDWHDNKRVITVRNFAPPYSVDLTSIGAKVVAAIKRVAKSTKA
jgi:hypothetical protein